MAKIGNLGSLIVFSTNDKKVLTFSALSQEISGRWQQHDIIASKPKSEFEGPGLRKITFTIELNASLGVRPRRTMEAIEKAVENGDINTLVIGGKKIGNKWGIEKLSESWDDVLSKGELTKCSCDLSLFEYY